MEVLQVIDDIQIIEKPEWVSWEDIKQCLLLSHESNRAKGVNMAHYQWPAEEIAKYMGDTGHMLVALEGEKLVGTAGLKEKTRRDWYYNGQCGYMCFAGVLPEYNGKGIYKALTEQRETLAKVIGYEMVIFDTHEQNQKLRKIAERNGFRYVRFFQAVTKDHYSVEMAKWLKKCPYRKIYCRYRYVISWLKTMVSTKIMGR